MGIPRSVGVCLWAAAFLALAEAGVRARAWYRYGGHGPVADIYELDAHGRRKLKPGSQLAGSERRVHINHLGFRGEAPAVPKPAGLLRVVVLGDSTTFGLEATDDDAVWVSQLESELRGTHGVNVETVNAGVPGYTLSDALAVFDERIAPLEPDIVVLQQVTTDIAAHSRKQFASTASTEKPDSLKQIFESHSLFLNLLKVNSSAWTSRWLATQRHDSLDDAGVHKYRNDLEIFVRKVQQRGWSVALCTAARSFGDPSAPSSQYELAASSLMHNPALSLAGLNDAFDRYNQSIRDVAGRPGILLIDLDRMIPRRGEYFVDAVHFNDAGHRLAGREAARELATLMTAARLAGSPR